MATPKTHLVNLDALIAREDFETTADVALLGKEPVFKVEELKRGRMYLSVLRKPEFQRETASWSPQMVLDFIECFLDNKLIPSIIIWHSRETGNVFIIDGAHRVSALIAWVNDDYGHGEISKAFHGSEPILEEQKKFHAKTKKLVDEQVGTYLELAEICVNSQLTTDPVKLRRARAIATRQPDIQKVDGSAAVAEDSFFKINANPATIDPVELDSIRARNKPNIIAKSAILKAGSSYKFCERFPLHGKTIQDLGKEVHELIFGPFPEIGSKSADVPRAGQPYSRDAYRMVLDMVNIFNNVTDATWQYTIREKPRVRPSTLPAELPNDTDGSATVQFLEKIKKIGKLVHGHEKGSFGFDQAVYSYGSTGKLHPAAFLASLKFASEIVSTDKAFEFTSVRKDFEEFLVAHKSFLNDLSHAKGGRTRPLESYMVMHRMIFECLQKGITSHSEIVEQLLRQPQLSKSLKEIEFEAANYEKAVTKTFSKTATSIAVVRDVLQSRSRCPLCGARLPSYARSNDHSIRAEEGGTGDSGNLQFTHAYCNTGYKERLRAKRST